MDNKTQAKASIVVVSLLCLCFWHVFVSFVLFVVLFVCFFVVVSYFCRLVLMLLLYCCDLFV